MINTLTLNPAADRIFFLSQLDKHTTNRAKDTVLSVGGKGTHVSMNLSSLGTQSRAFGLAYGRTGKFIVDSLEKCGVLTAFLQYDRSESRTNYVLVEPQGSSTTIAEKGVEPTEEEITALLALMEEKLCEGDYLVLAGDASNCPDIYIYNRIMRTLKHKHLRVFLDTSGKVLAKGLEESPYLIKPNQNEMTELCGFELRDDSSAVAAIDSMSEYSIPVIALSLGAAGSIVKINERIYKCVAPDVEVLNTAGCGDSFVAGLLHGLDKGFSETDALRMATAVSSAAAACPLSVGFDVDYAHRLFDNIDIKTLR